MPLGPGFSTPPKLVPGATTFPPVSRSSFQISPDRFYSRLFLRRSPPTLLTPAARSGLEPAPDRRLRGTYPHLSCSSTPLSMSVCSRHTQWRILTNRIGTKILFIGSEACCEWQTDAS